MKGNKMEPVKKLIENVGAGRPQEIYKEIELLLLERIAKALEAIRREAA